MKTRKKRPNATASCRRTSSVVEAVISSEDLLTAILLCLPAKQLLKFKSVSKKWRGLISDSKFSFQHTRHNPNFVSSALILANLDLFSISHPNSSRRRNPRFFRVAQLTGLMLVDSCNGLILCKCTKKIRDYVYTYYLVSNPTTGEYSLLYNHVYSGNTVHASLVFDPSKSPHFFVVEAIFEHCSPRWVEIDIYQSEFGTWAGRLKLNFPSEWGNTGGVKSFWKGAIHWISECGYLIWFDLYSKELTGNKLPVHPTIQPFCIEYFGECDGRLFLIPTNSNTTRGFSVLEMGSDYCRWRATYKINLTGLVKKIPTLKKSLKRGHRFSVMSIVKGGQSEDLSLVIAIAEKRISYGLCRKKWFVLDDSFSDLRCYPFIESLAPV